MYNPMMNRGRLWRRWVRLGAVALVIGAIVNVFVAWAIPLAGLPAYAITYVGPASAWPADPPAGWPDAPNWYGDYNALGYNAVAAFHKRRGYLIPTDAPTTVTAREMFVQMYGFPMRSLRTVRLTVAHGRTVLPNTQSVFARGIPWPNAAMIAERLAFIPIWPGFAVNTVVYGAPVLGMVLGAGALRARRRVRGRCVSCNYTLAGLTTCPECGREAPQPRRGAGKDRAWR